MFPASQSPPVPGPQALCMHRRAGQGAPHPPRWRTAEMITQSRLRPSRVCSRRTSHSPSAQLSRYQKVRRAVRLRAWRRARWGGVGPGGVAAPSARWGRAAHAAPMTWMLSPLCRPIRHAMAGTSRAVYNPFMQTVRGQAGTAAGAAPARSARSVGWQTQPPSRLSERTPHLKCTKLFSELKKSTNATTIR